MAFFKFRKGGDEHATPAPAPESVEAMRTRARHRLIGASVLVLLGVIGFPLLFDSQPRPISVDIPIEIPDKNTVKPLVTTSQAKVAEAVVVTEPDAGKPIAAAPVTPAPAPAVRAPVASPALATAPVPATSRASTGAVTGSSAPVVTTPAVKAVVKTETKVETKPEAKASDKPAEKPLARPDDGAKAQALLEGKEAATPVASASVPLGASGRFVVQIGAYSEAAKAQEARVKLERAGMKTYTQVVQPKEGKRIRVRVGPFESKAEADKAAEKIRKLDLPAAILEL